MMGASGPPGRAEGAPAIRLAIAKDQDAAGDQREREQRADIGEVGERADVEKPGRNSDDEARHPSGKVRGAIVRMHAAEDARQQAVARHREPHARLSELKDQQGRDHAHERAEQDDQADAA